jgi:SARP family transcriptional regulator, regulator of embCAB operon
MLLAGTLHMTAPARIQLCGRLIVELGGRDVAAAVPGGHGRVLFSYLVIHRRRSLARDELKEALWPVAPPRGADNTLSSLLSRLRRALGAGVLEGRGELRLLLSDDACIDIEEADEALHRAHSTVAREAWAEGWEPALDALAVARRDFLAGVDAPWVDEVRGRLEEVRCSALECHAAIALGLGEPELAIGEKAARELVSCSPYRERGYALLMRLLAARGNPAEALRVYEVLRVRLREDLGIVPTPRLRELQSQLLRTGDLVPG